MKEYEAQQQKMIEQIFETERFIKLGVEDDYRLQAVVWLAEASQKLSLARTVLVEHEIVETEQLQNLMRLQNELHLFRGYLSEKNNK